MKKDPEGIEELILQFDLARISFAEEEEEEEEEEPSIVASLRDITERKRAEKKLRDSEDRYKELWDNAPVAYHTLDIKGIITSVNQTEAKMLGYTPEEMIGKSIFEFVLPEQRAEARKRFQLKITGHKIPKQKDRMYVKKDGSRIYVSIDDVLERDSEGKVIGVRTTMIDITERKRAEDKLRESEAKFRRIWESSFDGLRLTDKEGRIVMVNDQFCQMIGKSRAELVGTLFTTCYHYPDAEQTLKSYQQRYESRTIEPHLQREIEISDGRKVWFDLSNSFLDSESGSPLVLSIFRDITERKRQELIQQVLYQISSAVHATKSISELSGVIQQELGSIIDTKNFFIALYNKKDDTLSLPYYKDETDHFETFPAGKTCTAYVIRNDRALLADREKIDELVKAGEVEIIGTLSKVWLGVPLKLGAEVTGAMVVQSYTDENAYSEKDLEILKYIAEQLGLFIERKRAEEDLRKRLEELEIYYKATIGREGRIIELKQQVNELLVQIGKEKKYEV